MPILWIEAVREDARFWDSEIQKEGQQWRLETPLIHPRMKGHAHNDEYAVNMQI